jgi:hypothetical protein
VRAIASLIFKTRISEKLAFHPARLNDARVMTGDLEGRRMAWPTFFRRSPNGRVEELVAGEGPAALKKKLSTNSTMELPSPILCPVSQNFGSGDKAAIGKDAKAKRVARRANREDGRGRAVFCFPDVEGRLAIGQALGAGGGPQTGCGSLWWLPVVRMLQRRPAVRRGARAAIVIVGDVIST